MDHEVIAFGSRDEWEAWLATHHETASGVWLKIARKATGIATVTYQEALEIALCYGWIDGQRAGHDDRYFRQRFTPRRPRSNWSAKNRDSALALIAAGRMRPAGQREVERAQADGRWERAYPPPSRMTVPDDLRAALDQHPTARGHFAGLDSQNRYAILYRIHDAKRPETRARRIGKYVAMLDEGQKIYP